MQITVQSLLTASAVLAAALALLGSYNRLYNWYRKQERQEEDIRDIKAEQSLLTCGVLASIALIKYAGAPAWVDSAISFLIALVILKTAYDVFHVAADELT